jgi:hypothetical protein
MWLLYLLIPVIAIAIVFGSHVAAGVLLVYMIIGGASLLIAAISWIINRPPRGWR